MENTLIQDVGAVVSCKTNQQIVDVVCTLGHIQLTVFSPNVIKIYIYKSSNQAIDDFSYAVQVTPTTCPFTVDDTSKSIVVKTSALSLELNKVDTQITCTTPQGTLINCDEPGLRPSWIDHQVTVYKHLQDGERFIGLGEKIGGQDKRGMAFTNWNTDVFGYRVDQDPLYTSFPFYVGIHHGLNYGIFFDNSYQTDFNFGASNNRFASFSAKGGQLAYYFIFDDTLAQLVEHYTWLTGRMPMPALWSLGYQQNRYSYYPDGEVLHIANRLRANKIPADGITLDIHYMDNYKLFTWNNERFPQPAELIAKLKQLGITTTVIVDPGIKVEADYPAYESGVGEDVFIKYPDNTYYTGQVWPGWCHFPDFTNSRVRQWWGKQMEVLLKEGVDGVWNDMNEIATWGNKMPDNLYFDYDQHPCTHAKAHNVYGLKMVQASYDGFLAENPNKRPFILTRAAYSGVQRYAAVWTGDNRAEDDHMLLGIRMMLSMGVCGVAFTGMDIGGFTGGASCNLYIRWMQLGVFTPYMRNHAQINTKSAEPWTFGEEALEICRNYINIRYQLLPYIYSAFREAHKKGLPIMRSLAFDFTHNEQVYQQPFDNQFLFGSAFLVIPVTSTAEFAEVFLPAETANTFWYDLYTDRRLAADTHLIKLDKEQLPVYVRESSIVPMQSLVQSTAYRPQPTLDIHLYKGNRANTYQYYEDDGASFAYQNGAFYTRQMCYDPELNQFRLEAVEGTYSSNFTKIRLLLHGFSIKAIHHNGIPLEVHQIDYQWIAAVSNFDPQMIVKTAPSCVVDCVEMAFSEGLLVLQLS